MANKGKRKLVSDVGEMGDAEEVFENQLSTETSEASEVKSENSTTPKSNAPMAEIANEELKPKLKLMEATVDTNQTQDIIRQLNSMTESIEILKNQVIAISPSNITTPTASIQKAAMISERIPQVSLTETHMQVPPQTVVSPQRNPDIEDPCGGNCKDCECVCSSCCCFEIYLHKIRVQTLGGPAGLFGEGGIQLELQIYATVNGIGSLYPSLGGHVMVQGKLVGAGAWWTAGHLINKVCIPKGITKSITVDFEIKENDKIFKDDIGSAPKDILLNCCTSELNVLSHEVQLISGDGGQATIGMQIRIEKVC